MEKKGWFDADAFHEALDGVRQARALTWKQVAAQSGVSASTLTRMAQGKRPNMDEPRGSRGVVGTGSGIAYVRSAEVRPSPEPLALISTYLRSDKNLSRSRDRNERTCKGHLRAATDEDLTPRWVFDADSRPRRTSSPWKCATS